MGLMLPGEKCYIFLKSLKDEFVFTNYSLIFSDGESVNSPKRALSRTNWNEGLIQNVKMNTAGLVDLDVDISFDFVQHWRIELKKEEVENAKLVFKCLDVISNRQLMNKQLLEMEMLARNNNAGMNVHLLTGADAVNFNDSVIESGSKWAALTVEKCMPRDYGAEFESVLIKRL